MQVNLYLISQDMEKAGVCRKYIQQGEDFRKPEVKVCTPNLSPSKGLELLSGNRSSDNSYWKGSHLPL